MNSDLDLDNCYSLLQAKDSRFDGVFFVGVRTTGIYCRPVCRAKTPRKDRCLFFLSAAAAESAGFRPCLRCRPELSPGNARIDSVSRLAALIVNRIEDGALSNGTVEELASEMGISSRHLRRVIETEFGVAPLELAQTQRLLLAKRLLTDTDLPITEIAFASGFSSVRRFNTVFKERYDLPPGHLRRKGAHHAGAKSKDSLVCEIAYKPPYDYQALLQFLSLRIFEGVEAINANTYMRTVAFGNRQGWITIKLAEENNILRLKISFSVAADLLSIVARIKRLFDVQADPQIIESALGSLSQQFPGLRVPGAFNGFELALRAILGQQISVQAAHTLARRFVERFAEPMDTPFPQIRLIFPRADRIARLTVSEISALGITPRRAETILSLARLYSDNQLSLEPGADIERSRQTLHSISGIGEWTAQYIAMRALGWTDAFPEQDLGIIKALGIDSIAEIRQAAEAWRPWRAYAAMHLWKKLEQKYDHFLLPNR